MSKSGKTNAPILITMGEPAGIGPEVALWVDWMELERIPNANGPKPPGLAAPHRQVRKLHKKPAGDGGTT